MKRILIFCLLILAMTAPCWALTYDSTYYSRRKAWALSPDDNVDPIYRFIDEIEDLVGGVPGTGKIWYVDAGATTGQETGLTLPDACLTIDACINLIYTDGGADRGDRIYVAQNSDESYTAANGFDADVAGITICWLGNGSERGTLTFADTDATIAIGAAGVTLVNPRLLAGIDGVVMGVSVEAGGDYCTIIGLEVPEAVASSDYEFETVIKTAAGTDHLSIIGFEGINADAVGMYSFIDLSTGVINDLLIADSTFIGECASAAIFSDDADKEVMLRDLSITNLTSGQHGIEFTGATTGMARNIHIQTNARATAFDAGALSVDETCRWSDSDSSNDETTVPIFPPILDATSDFVQKLSTWVADGDGDMATGTALASDKSLVDALGTNGTTVVDGATSVAGIIGMPTDADHVVDSTTVTDNLDGSIFERLEYVQQSVQVCVAIADVAVASGTANLFVISGGPVIVEEFVGIVTSGMDATTTNCQIIEAVTTPSGNVLLSTAVAIDTDAAGTSYTYTAAAPGVLTPTTAGGLANVPDYKWLCPIGTIATSCDAANTGTATWYMIYRPLLPDSVVVASS